MLLPQNYVTNAFKRYLSVLLTQRKHLISILTFMMLLASIVGPAGAQSAITQEKVQKMRATCSASIQSRIGCQLALFKIWTGAMAGNAKYQVQLGNIHRSGWFGSASHLTNAEKWFVLAANQNHAGAQYQLYQINRIANQDLHLGLQWLLRSAENKHKPAVSALGQLYQEAALKKKNKAQTLNPNMAVDHLQKMAEQGDSDAQFKLALHLNHAEGVEQKNKLSFEWMLKAATQNHALAQLNVGLQYFNGVGVQKDDEQAHHWIKSSAEQKQPEGQYFLGMMYVNGEIVEKNVSKALPLLKSAAKNGAHEANLTLALLYKGGDGVQKNTVLAEDYKYTGLAWKLLNEQQGPTYIKLY